MLGQTNNPDLLAAQNQNIQALRRVHGIIMRRGRFS